MSTTALEAGQRLRVEWLPALDGGLMMTAVGVVALVGSEEAVIWFADLRRYWPVKVRDLRAGGRAVAGAHPAPGVDVVFDSIFRVEHPAP